MDSSVVYGVRKSYVWAKTAAKQAYARAMELSEPSPTLAAQMQIVLEMLSAREACSGRHVACYMPCMRPRVGRADDRPATFGKGGES